MSPLRHQATLSILVAMMNTAEIQNKISERINLRFPYLIFSAYGVAPAAWSIIIMMKITTTAIMIMIMLIAFGVVLGDDEMDVWITHE